MSYVYYDLRELFYGAPNLTSDVRNKIKKAIGPAGPFLRYKDNEPTKEVKLKLTSRRAYTFRDVGSKMELVFADGTTKPVTGESIDLPLPYYPCSSNAWNNWKQFGRYSGNKIINLYTFKEGIVVLNYLWADCDVYRMHAYKFGRPFGHIDCPNKCDPGRSFFEEMMSSYSSEPFIEQLREKYGIMF